MICGVCHARMRHQEPPGFGRRSHTPAELAPVRHEVDLIARPLFFVGMIYLIGEALK